MASIKEIQNTVSALAQPIADGLSLILWDVQFKKEGASWFLKVLLDKDGGISVEDCEALSRALSNRLDETDPISQQYFLEVSSAGLDRELYRESDFAQFLGARVEVRLYVKREGEKLFIGDLVSYENGRVTIDREGEMLSFDEAEYGIVRLYPEF